MKYVDIGGTRKGRVSGGGLYLEGSLGVSGEKRIGCDLLRRGAIHRLSSVQTLNLQCIYPLGNGCIFTMIITVKLHRVTVYNGRWENTGYPIQLSIYLAFLVKMTQLSKTVVFSKYLRFRLHFRLSLNGRIPMQQQITVWLLDWLFHIWQMVIRWLFCRRIAIRQKEP